MKKDKKKEKALAMEVRQILKEGGVTEKQFKEKLAEIVANGGRFGGFVVVKNKK